ncbi:MAG: DUF1501 domain-containing protein, partial [Myxococcales bacterium]|nr:DUF1501 domain-containing protein [Myxococcales bacterium]
MTTSILTRRALLRGALIAGGGAAAYAGGLHSFGRLAQAQRFEPDGPDRYYVFCYFRGGWDVLLSLDPRDPVQFNDGRIRTTLIQPGYDRVEKPDANLVRVGEHSFGPYIGDLARRHMNRLAVIRGMSMDTLTHEAGRRRFLTGKPPAGLAARGSNGSTWLAAQLGERHPIPQLSVDVESYNKGLPNFASSLRVNNVADLLRALRPSEPRLAPRARELVDHRLAEAAACSRGQASESWGTAENARLKAREMVLGGYADRFDFNTNTPEMVALKAHYGINRVDASPEVQAALAAQALTSGVARVVSIQMAAGNLDTHFDEWETDQGPIQERGFNAVARLVEDLGSREYRRSGRSWLDHTTIVGFSEFSRTPMLNDRGGRDHHLGNSCFLLGGGVKGNQVIGRSSDVGMAPQPVDLQTGRPDPEGEVVRPEHVLQAL